jgi:hypothetical protein
MQYYFLSRIPVCVILPFSDLKNTFVIDVLCEQVSSFHTDLLEMMYRDKRSWLTPCAVLIDAPAIAFPDLENIPMQIKNKLRQVLHIQPCAAVSNSANIYARTDRFTHSFFFLPFFLSIFFP